MKKYTLVIYVIIFTFSLIISGCERKDKAESSAITIGESDVTTSQNETSSNNSSKSTVDRISSSESTGETQTSSKQKEDVSEYAFGIRLASESETIFHTITMKYSEEELKEIINMPDIKTLNEKYPTEHLRIWKIMDGEPLGYRAVYVGEEKTAVLFFGSDGYSSMLNRFLEPQGYKEDFEKFSVGERLEKVRELYPGGLYSSMFNNIEPGLEYSDHITKDGYYVDIYYDREPSAEYEDSTIKKIIVDLL